MALTSERSDKILGDGRRGTLTIEEGRTPRATMAMSGRLCNVRELGDPRVAVARVKGLHVTKTLPSAEVLR